MKIQCDACSSAQATLFCCADEAALCKECDSKVHDANKLASKHHRLLLSDPSPDSLRCDICQERRGFFFCQADRAIFCRDCDASIHSANNLTAIHTRYLVSGIKARPPSENDSSSSQPSNADTTTTAENSTKSMKRSRKVVTPCSSPVPTATTVTKDSVPQENWCDKGATLTTDGSGEMLMYLSKVEEFLTTNIPAKLDCLTMQQCYQDDYIGKIWLEEWNCSSRSAIEDSLAKVPKTLPLLGDGMSSVDNEKPAATMTFKPKFTQQSFDAWRPATPFYDNSGVDDNFVVPDIVGLASSEKRLKLSQHHIPDRFLL